MQLTLQNFESALDQKIVGRGNDYYKNDAVRRLEKVGENEFSAVVLGTKRYNIFVKIKDETITKHECDCPYDGDVCKHKVAVFYSIKKGDFKDISDKINSLMENLHEAALRRFILNLLKKDQRFRSDFLREFDEDFEEDEDDFDDEDYY